MYALFRSQDVLYGLTMKINNRCANLPLFAIVENIFYCFCDVFSYLYLIFKTPDVIMNQTAEYAVVTLKSLWCPRGAEILA